MRPMLASATPDAERTRLASPAAPDWLYEVKWDGMRVLVGHLTTARCGSPRAASDVTGPFPSSRPSATSLPDVLLDGEVVAMVDGRPSFRALAERMHVRTADGPSGSRPTRPVVLMVFDILLALRRQPAGPAARGTPGHPGALDLHGPHWQVPPAYDDGAALVAATREQGLEGVVSQTAYVDLPARASQPRLGQAGASAGAVVPGRRVAAGDRQPDPDRRPAARRPRPARGADLRRSGRQRHQRPGPAAAQRPAAPAEAGHVAVRRGPRPGGRRRVPLGASPR